MTRARRYATTIVSGLLLVSALPVAAAADDPVSPIVPVSTNAGCDPLDKAACLFPFPNNLFTQPDPSTATGRRVAFSPAAMPRNGTEVTEGGEGKPIDPMEWNRNDGFSPGSMVMTHVGGLDLHMTWGTQDRPHGGQPNEPGYFDHRDHIADIGLYAREDAPIVILNADTGARHPFWSELDTHPAAIEAGEQSLILRPAANFEEGARYVVALRNLKTADGATIEAGPDFAAYRSGNGGDATRQTYFNSEIFPVLESAGIAREELFLAWDFTVASERNLAERILHMRDDAFAQLGDTNLADRVVQGQSPSFTIDKIETRADRWTDARGVAHVQQLRRIHGRVTVPNYMDRIQQTEGHVRATQLPYDVPVPGSRLLDVNQDGRPEQNPVEPTVNVPFLCEVPLNGQQNYATLYGHGLLGTRSQVGDIKSPRRAGPFLGCAADWWGMSTPDFPTVAAILADASNFPSLPDRAQQGFLNFMFLGRAAVHPDGFATDEAFQQDGQPLVKTATEDSTPLFYDGNSQGGIMGGSLVAVSPDIQRGILGVPGMNYSTLLNRSVDWEGAYAEVFYEIYRDPIERQLVFALMQMLWDRGEANGYAHHMTSDPLQNTPAHDVMLQVAFSDHQVTNVAAEVEARTIDAPIMTPGLPEGLHWEMNPYFGQTATYPYDGSAFVYWDSGNATPPNANVPAHHNGDPHGDPRNEPAAAWQEAHFLLTGQMYDVCEGGDYLTKEHPANAGTASCRPPEWAPGAEPVRSEQQPTALQITEASQEAGQYSDGTLFQAELKDASGAPVAGAELSFELAGADGSRSFGAVTDDNGLASVTPILTERPGAYELTASFAGSETFQPASATAPFLVEKEDTALSLQVTGRGSRRTLTADLTDADSAEGVAGREVEFFVDGSSIGSGTTDVGGSASIEVPPRYRGGQHVFEARFYGDDFYQPSSGSAP
ncbi:MAG: hypothetical protein M3N53_00180 [Actinomycetota bacterium]|nr:hypothetical protein [Actinomycetota bacterium]